MDDTLVDFKKCAAISLKNTHALYFSHVRFEQFKRTFDNINIPMWQRVEAGTLTPAELRIERFQQIAKELDTDYHESLYLHFEQEIVNNCEWIESGNELLEGLQAKGVKIGFITNGFTQAQKLKYQKLKLSRFSEHLVISDEIGCSKPHRAIFHHSLQLLGVSPEECLMVGDSLSSDGEGARQAGLPFCWFNPGKEPFPKWKPHFTIAHLGDLLAEISPYMANSSACTGSSIG